jgi:hypothetical protein
MILVNYKLYFLFADAVDRVVALPSRAKAAAGLVLAVATARVAEEHHEPGQGGGE